LYNLQRKAAIQDSCSSRKIEVLVHFTRMENLAGILKEGLVPRASLEARTRRPIFNDQVRRDGHKDAVCLSISFPNYRMFYKYRCADQTSTWSVLLIKPDVLWEFDCAFCWTNAADSAIIRQPLAILKESSSLRRMFTDRCEITGVNRADCQIPDKFPTDPQAEVLVFSHIPLSFITGVTFPDAWAQAKYCGPPQQTVPASFGVNSAYFRPRCDWEIWRPTTETNRGDEWQEDLSSIPF
jgi:ssDNA thymidine ADP-ribosyltransferase, DarT